MAQRTCSVDGCDRKHAAKGFCGPHYWKVRKYGEPGGPVRSFKPRPGTWAADCAAEGCDRRGNNAGLCHMHSYRAKANGDSAIKRHPGPSAGDDHPAFRGDDIGYNSAHARVKRRRGKAREQVCLHCGLAAQHWAVIHERATFMDSTLGLRYSTNPDDYMPMCAPCHSAYDNELLEMRTERTYQDAAAALLKA